MSQKVPEGWGSGQFDAFITLQRGFDLPVQNRIPGDYLVIASNGAVGTHSDRRIPGPAVVTGRSGTIGNVFIEPEGCWPLNTTLYVKDFHGNDPEYVYWFLRHFDLSRFSTGTGVPTLNRNIVHRESIVFPPLSEQRRIAEILSSVDEAIAATKAVIEQTRTLKQGVMKRVLTKGIGHSRFKKTELGEIPETWRIVQISEIVSPEGILTGPFGTTLSESDFVDSGVPVLRIGNVRESHIDTEKLLYVSLEKAKTLTRYCVRANDILFARQGATTGRNCLTSQEHSGWLINYHIIRLRIDPSVVDPRYVYNCLNSPLVKAQVSANKEKGNRDGINCGQIAAFRIPLPPIQEAGEISDVLHSFLTIDQEYYKQMHQLLAVKHTLMSDLLTGRKRVTADALSSAL